MIKRSLLALGSLLLLLIAGHADARFVSVDPVKANANSGTNFNRYYYANNNPYKYTDPDGRQAFAGWSDQQKSLPDGAVSTVGMMLLCSCNPDYKAPAGSGAVQPVLTPMETAGASALARGGGALLSSGASATMRWGPATGAGPLGEAVASTFRGGSYTQMVTQESTTLFRAYGGQAGPMGSYWSRTAPTGPMQARIDSALAPQWGNTAEKVSSISVPKGTTIFEGAAAPQGNLVGGGNQVFIPKPLPEWMQFK